MRREPGGWWRADVADADAAGGYRYAIDGQGPVPDPRSRWQPGGVHGPSHIVAAAAAAEASGSGEAFAFSPKPMQEAVIYELHVGTFTPAGTYEAAAGRL